ncbi:unnamed protein product [Closterium sp. NIES-53]
MTTLRVLLHVAAQRDYELHSLDLSTAFLQGSLHEEIWLRRPPVFTTTFPAGTQWSLRRPVYGLRHVPCKWHDTLRTTLAALGFASSTADPSLFLRTDTSLPPFYVLVYVDDLVFSTVDTEALTLVKFVLQKRQTSTDLGEVLQCFGFQFSLPQPTPLSTSHSLSAPPSVESVEPTGPYPELVGCLMYLMTCTRPDLAYPLSLLACYVAPDRHRKALYDDVVAHYSSPATTALGRLLLPYLFPELSAFATIEDLVSHLRASDARYRAAIPAKFLDKNQPPMFITLYFIVIRLPDSLRSVWDHFLSLDPTSLTVDLLEQHLLAAETNAVAVGAACGTLRRPFFEGCSPFPLALSYTSAAAADVSSAEDVRAASASAKCRSGKGKGGKGGGGGSGCGGGGSGSSGGGSSGRWWRRCPYVICMGNRAGHTCRRLHTQHRCFSRLDDAWRAEFGDDIELPRWADLLRSRIAIFDLDFDAILSAICALSVSAEGDCYWCVLPDLGIASAALSASESGTLPGTAPAQALHTFTLDSGASAYFFRDSTTLTPLSAAVPIRQADPSGGPVVARSSTVLQCPAVPSGSLSGLHLPSFSANLVSTAALQDAMVTTTTPGGQRVKICTCTRKGRHLATFNRRPGSSLYTLATEPVQVAASAQMFASGQVAASCLCRVLSHQTLLWHHHLGHPSLPRLHGMHSRLLVFGLPRSLPPLRPSPAPPCLPCVEGRQRAAPHSSSFPPTSAPLQTLHIDVWGPAHLRERFGQDLRVLRLHSNRDGEFSSNLLRDFCRGEDLLQLFTLPDSPVQNEIAERCIGRVMKIARTSMIHAAAPHFLWPVAVRYSAHQLNLWPRVSLPETSPTLRWTGEVGDASVFQVWGSCAFVRDTSADKLSPRTIPCVFLGFVPDAPGWQFYHPTSRHVFPSQDVTFDESVPFYRLFPCRSAPTPPPPLFLAPGPPVVDPHPPQGPDPSGVSQVDPLLGPTPVQAPFGSGAAQGAASGGAEPGGAKSEGAETGGAEPGAIETGGGEPGGAEPEGIEAGGAASDGAESGGAEPQGAASSGATGAGGAGAAGGGGAGVAAGASVIGGTATTGPGGARTRGTGAAAPGGVEGAGAGDSTDSGATGAGGSGAGGAGAGGAGIGGTGAGGPGIGGVGAGGAGAVDPGGACPPPDQLQPPLQPASPLHAPSPYTEQFSGLTECPPPQSSLPEVPDPESDCARAASPTVSRLVATAVTDPSFESTASSALVAELLDFDATCRLDYTTALVDESVSASPPSVGGECALGMDVLEDRQEDFECLAAAVPRFASMLLAPEGDPDAPDISTPRSYVEAIMGPYSSQWQASMDAEMASWKSTGTYVDEVSPPGANIVDGMWIFRVKRPPGSPPAFKAPYVARGFSERQGVDYFHTFSPTPKMTTLRVLLHVAAQRDYELHSLDCKWSLRRPVYGLHQAPREWHDTLRNTLAALGFAPATAGPSLFLRTNTSLPLFYVLVYVDDLVFPTEALTLVKSELQKRHTCTDLGVLLHFGFQFSLPQPTPLSTSHSLSAPPLDESVELSGLYSELVGCLMYLMTCTRPDLAYPLSLLACYVAPGRHRKVRWDAAKRVLRYLCSTAGMGLVLGGRGPVVFTGHADASWVDDSATQRSSQGYTFSLGCGSVFWRSTRSSSVLSSRCEAEIYAWAMAALKLCWFT